MATKILYRKRRFLNQLGYHSGAFIFAEMTRETWSRKNTKTKKRIYTSDRFITLSIADCSRIINLDLELDGKKSTSNNDLAKLDALIDTLQDVKETYVQELEVIKKEKRKK